MPQLLGLYFPLPTTHQPLLVLLVLLPLLVPLRLVPLLVFPDTLGSKHFLHLLFYFDSTNQNKN
jgi:hypothetical protein